jgi:post-segregation antitoxin (ccd killing protein)
MVVTINIPDELATAAKARGLSLEAYVQEILAQQLARPAETRQPRTPEEDSRLARFTCPIFRQDSPVA